MEPPPDRGCHPAGGGRAALGPLDGLGGDGGCEVVGFVLGLGLEGQEPAQLAFHGGAVGPGLAEQDEHLIVIVPGRSVTEPGAAHGVGGIDASVDGQAGRGDAPTRGQVATRGLCELLGLRGLGANLRARHRLDPAGPRHARPSAGRRCRSHG